MPISRHSFRRVIGDMVHRHNMKNDSTKSSSNGHHKTNSRSRQKSDRNSLISNDSLSVCEEKNKQRFIYLFVYIYIFFPSDYTKFIVSFTLTACIRSLAIF